MQIVDTALAKRAAANKPIRVALVGAGFAARTSALQILTAARGMQLVAIANRTLSKAERAYRDAGVDDVVRVTTVAELEKSIDQGRFAVTEDPMLVCRAGQIDAVIEATGNCEIGTEVAFEAIKHGKHVVLMSAEVDASVGPILKVYADKAGVVITYTDGDEPGVAMNLFRFVDSIGYKPVMIGQVKGFLDHYRNPVTQTELAMKLGQNPAILASFADGSKLALEAALTGNGTGFMPQVRGMHGHKCTHVKELLTKFQHEDFANGGLVEYTLGTTEPNTGAFVICYNEHPLKRELMTYLKMGNGPYYCFYTPYHLPPMQVQHSVARAVLFQDATLTPLGAPVCDSVSYAKYDLQPGEVLDAMGGMCAYGLVERYDVCQRENFLPIAISLNCRLKHAVKKDQPIRYSDVELPGDRLCDRLRLEQASYFQTNSR
jgi:predicted homoserine dehydrogenase-like protein